VSARGLPDLKDDAYVLMDGEGLREKSCRRVQDFLAAFEGTRLLIAAATDTSGLGALQAVREMKREKNVAIVGQDCINEALEEMKTPGTPYIASVSHEAGSYGPRLIQLGFGNPKRANCASLQLHRAQASHSHVVGKKSTGGKLRVAARRSARRRNAIRTIPQDLRSGRGYSSIGKN